MALTATFAADMSGFLKSLSDAQVKLQVFDKAVRTSARDLTKNMESFSGQKIAAEAARMAEAVQRVGGASKLTEAEQRRVNATVTEALAKYKALGQEAPANLQKLAAETAKVSKASGGLSAMLTGAVAGATAAVATAALDAAKQLGVMAAQGIGAVVRRGGEVAAIHGAFERLSGGVDSADAAVAKMRTSTSGLITSFDLMQASNKAMLLNLGLSTDQMADLSKTAVTLGRAMGMGANKSLDDFITALGRSSPMILDNLGLSVKVGEANEKYARALGTTAARLTDAQRKQAFMNAAMDAARAKQAALGDVQLTLAERAKQAQVWLGNMFDQVSRGIVASPVLTAGLSELAKQLQSAFGDDQKATVKRFVDEVDRLAISLAGALPAMLRGLDTLQLGLAANKIVAEEAAAAFLNLAGITLKLGQSVLEVKRVIDPSEWLTGMSKSMIDSFGASIAELEQEYNSLKAVIAADTERTIRWGNALQGAAGHLETLRVEMERAHRAGEKGAGAGATSSGVSALEAEVTKADDAMKKLLASVRALGGQEALAGAQAAVKELEALGGPMRVLPSQMAALAKRFTDAAEAAMLMGKVKLAKEYQLLARTLTPVTQLQQRYNVTIGEYLTHAPDMTQAVLDQNAALRENATVYFGIVPSVKSAVSALVPFRTAIQSSTEAARRSKAEIAKGLFDDVVSGVDAAAAGFQRLGQVAGRGMGRVAEGITVAAEALKDMDRLIKEINDQDKIGAVLAGIKLIGSAAGSMWDALTVSAGEKAAKEVGRHFGVRITEAMGDAIADTAKELFRGDRFAASIFRLSDIVDAGGGLDSDNLREMTKRLRDVFVMVEKGAFTANQAVKVLDGNFGQFLDAATDAAGRVSPSMLEIVRLTRELGLASKEVAGFMRDQATAAITGANAIIGASRQNFDAWQQTADAVKKAQEEIDKLHAVEDRGRGVEWAREMAKAQADLTKHLTDQHRAAEGAGAELANLGTIALATFNAAIQAGMSHSQALQAAGPGLAQIVTAYENLGLSIDDAAVKALLMHGEIFRSNPQLIAGIDGLAQSFIALSNMGMLNEDTFRAMQEAGQRMYDQLQQAAADFGLHGEEATRAALVPMQDYLRQAAEQAKLFGIPLDENTQRLIDQSKEAGIWRDKTVGPMEEIRDAALEIRDAVKDMADALRGVPRRVDTEVTTRYRSEGDRPDGGVYAPGGPRPTAAPTVSAASSAAAGGTLVVPVSIDGRQVAVATLPHFTSAMRQRGV